MVNQNALEMLNTIAGKPAETGPSPRQQQIEHQNSLAIDKAKSLEHLSPSNRYKTIVNDIIPTMDDVEAQWALKEQYHPTQSLEQDTLDDIEMELKTKGTKQEEYFYFQDNYGKWPKKLRDRYRQRAENTLEYNPHQVLQDSIINLVGNARGIVSESLRNMKLGGMQSLNTVVEYFRTAIEHGYRDIHTNEKGEMVVPKGGKNIPIGTLTPEENPASPLEQQIMRAYVEEAIVEEVQPYWENARNKLREDIRLKDKTLFNRLGTPEGKDLNKFWKQITATAAEYEIDKNAVVKEGIEKMMRAESEKGMYNNPFEYLAGYLQKVEEMQKLLEERYPNG